MLEPAISQIKHDHGILKNYLKGITGYQINTILAGTGFNVKKMLSRIKEQILFILFQILNLCKLLLIQKYKPTKHWAFKVKLTNATEPHKTQ